MNLTAEGLGRIVRTVWSTQLGLELEADETVRAEPPGAALTVVRFRGGFEGTLTQRCSHRLSEIAAAAAFAAPARAVTEGDVRDTLAELAHVTAGNLKSLLPSPCEVSFPSTDAPEDSPGKLVAEVGFRFDGEPLTVSLARSAER